MEKDFLRLFSTNLDESHDHGLPVLLQFKEMATNKAENMRPISYEHTLASTKEAIQSAQEPATTVKEISTVLPNGEIVNKISL